MNETLIFFEKFYSIIPVSFHLIEAPLKFPFLYVKQQYRQIS